MPKKMNLRLSSFLAPEEGSDSRWHYWAWAPHKNSSVQRSQQKAHFCNLRVAIIGNQGQVLRVHCPAPDAGNEWGGDVATHTPQLDNFSRGWGRYPLLLYNENVWG